MRACMCSYALLTSLLGLRSTRLHTTAQSKVVQPAIHVTVLGSRGIPSVVFFCMVMYIEAGRSEIALNNHLRNKVMVV